MIQAKIFLEAIDLFCMKEAEDLMSESIIVKAFSGDEDAPKSIGEFFEKAKTAMQMSHKMIELEARYALLEKLMETLYDKRLDLVEALNADKHY